MKHIKSLTTTGLFILGFGLPMAAHCQTYQLSRTISDIGFSFTDLGNPIGSATIPGVTFNETVIVNPGAATIEQIGSFSLPPAAFSLTNTETRSIPPIFPNPPQTLTGILTLNVAFGGGDVSFDTGAQPITYNGQNYSVIASAFQALPVELSYSLVTGGQTYTGSFDPNLFFGLNLSSQLDTANFPNSIGLSDNPDFGPGKVTVADFTAANGFQANIMLVPEPSVMALGGICAIGLLVFRRRK